MLEGNGCRDGVGSQVVLGRERESDQLCNKTAPYFATLNYTADNGTAPRSLFLRTATGHLGKAPWRRSARDADL